MKCTRAGEDPQFLSMVDEGIDDDENVFDVEAIVKDRLVGGRRQYLIKWAGYPHSENTWEDAENILSDGLIGEYERRKRERGSQGSTRKRQSKKIDDKNGTAREITNEWHEMIRRVTGAFRSSGGVLQIEYETMNGTFEICTSEDMRYKAPLKLFDFYEENLSFPE